MFQRSYFHSGSWAVALPLLLLAGVQPVSASESISADEVTELRQQLADSNALIGSLNQRVQTLENGQPSGGGLSPSDEARIAALEDMFLDMDERVGTRGLVQAFDAISIDIGGFLTQSLTVVKGGGSSDASFNNTQFELLIAAQITEEVSFFVAQGFLREADVDFTTPSMPFFRKSAVRDPLIISWANYKHSDAVQVRVGRFVTPQGIINIEHFPPVLLDINQPMFLRPFSGNTIFPNFLSGAQVHGKFFLGEGGEDVLSYVVFSGAFTGSDADDFISGGRVQLVLGDSGFTVGGNFTHGHRTAMPGSLGNMSIVPGGSLTTNDYNVGGADLLYDKGAILWKTEYFYSGEQGNEDRTAFYTQPGYRVNDKWIVFYRYDYLDPGQGLEQSTEHMVGFNFLPVSTVRIRAVYIRKEFKGTDDEADILQLSTTFSF